MAREKGEAFLFYFERWRGSRAVQRLSFTERGIFLEMLIEQWIRGSLPDDPQAVADAIAVSEAQVGEVLAAWPAVRRSYDTSDRDPSQIQNRALERVRTERKAWLRQKKSAARSRWDKSNNSRGDNDIGRTAHAVRPHIERNANRDELSRDEMSRVETIDPRGRAPRAHLRTVFDGSLPRDHANHVYCDSTFSICVPAQVHAKLIGPMSRRHNGDRELAHGSLIAWYATVAATVPADVVPEEPFKFWQRHFDAAFATRVDPGQNDEAEFKRLTAKGPSVRP